MKLALTQCTWVADLAGLPPRGATGTTLADRSARASHVLKHAKLREVQLVERLPAHALRGALRHPYARVLVSFVNLYREAIDEQAASTVREIVTRRLLVPSQPDRLLELFVGFELVDELLRLGYRSVQHRLLPDPKLPFARLRRGEEEISLWYQRALGSIPGGSSGSRYVETLVAAGLGKSSLRPDFVVVRRPGGEVLLVEVKFTAQENETPERVGVKDAFTYLHDSRSFLDGRPSPRALVAGWNTRAVLSDVDVMIAPQQSVGQALHAALASWDARQ